MSNEKISSNRNVIKKLRNVIFRQSLHSSAHVIIFISFHFEHDIFNILFLQLLNLRHHPESDLWDFVRGMYEQTKGYLIEHGCLPRIDSSTRLLVVHDEAQVLGDEFNGSFQSKSSSEDSLRPLRDPQTGAVISALTDHTKYFVCLAFTPDGQSIASGSDDGTMRITDAHTGELEIVLGSDCGHVCCVAYSPDGRSIVAGLGEGELQIWEATTGKSGPRWT